MIRRICLFAVGVAVLVCVLSPGVAHAEACGPWRPTQLSSLSGSLKAVVANGQFWVFGNSAYQSAMGSTWTNLGPGPPVLLVQVRLLGNTFVALGAYEFLATSSDGAHWNLLEIEPYTVPNTALNDFAWSGVTCVVVGFRSEESSGAYGVPIIEISPDLIHWTSVAAPSGGNYREELDGIVWTGARFVAVGQWFGVGLGGVVMVSDDGRNWTRIAGPGGRSVAWSGSELVAVGGTTQVSGLRVPVVWRSADGLTWQSTAVDSSYALAAVTWDGTRFVAVGQTTAYPPQAVIVTSPDGVTWGANETNESESLVAVGSYLGTTVAVGLNGTVLTQTCSGGEPLYVPAAAHLPGLNGASWRTDLEVHNPRSAQVAYAIELLRRDADNSAPASRSYTLAPGQSIRHLDALASLFGFTGAATLRITPVDGSVMTNARVFDDGAAGSYGQFVEGQGATSAVSAGKSARMIHVSQAADRGAGFRTNLGLVSASAAAMTVVADLFRADGTQLGELEIPLRPYESVQRTEVFREVTLEAVADGYIVVRTTTDGGRFFAYASVIDNRSNDPVYMPAR